MALSLAPSHFVTKMEENVKRVDDRLNDYIKDSNENNIHDIRTAIRRMKPQRLIKKFTTLIEW